MHMSMDAAGTLWLVYGNGYLQQVDMGSLKSLDVASALHDFFKGGTFLFRLFADRQSKPWVYIDGEPKGVFKVDPVTNTIRHFCTDDPVFHLNNNLIRTIAQDKKGAVWM